jgi:hypothetical protein
MTTTSPKAPEAQPAQPPSKASTIRLIVLLGVLATVVVMLLVDLLVFGPAAKQAQERLEAEASAKMRAGVGEGGVGGTQHFFTSADVERVVGRKPLKTVYNKEKDRAIQTFAWWGYIPLNRHRFQVLYRKAADGTLIYESHDGTQEFPTYEEPKPVQPANQPTRPDPATSEGEDKKPDSSLDNTTPSVPPSTDNPAKPDDMKPTEPPASETPAEGGTTPDK